MKSPVVWILILVLVRGMPKLQAQTPSAPSSQSREQPLTFVIVHGAWGGGWAFKDVALKLNQRGHTVYRPTLTGLGEKVHLASTNIDLDTHVTDVVNTILWEDLHNVVLVGHSYGGMVITGVADRIPQRIKHLIYLDAILPEDGQSVATLFEARAKTHTVTNHFVIPDWVKDTNRIPRDVPHPVRTFTQPLVLTNQAATTKIPATYVLTATNTNVIASDEFYPFYKRALARGWTTLVMEADHNPQRSKPAELATILENIALHRNPTGAGTNARGE